MAGAPTYQDLSRMKQEQENADRQMTQSQGLNQAVNAEAEMNRNPILAEYMSRGQQGLTPRPIDKYVMYATEVANAAPNQNEYSMAMIDSARQGRVPAEAVLADESVLPQYKQDLIVEVQQASEAAQGLGRIR